MTQDSLVARRVRAELAFHQVSGKEMASRLGLSQSAFSDRLTGSTDFRVGELQRIAAELGIPISRLVRDSDETPAEVTA